MGRKEKAGPAAQLLKLLFRKNILVVLGEKLVDPQVEGFLLDQKFMLGPDENSGNDEKWVALARPRVIKLSNISCSIFDQTVWVSIRTFWILDCGWKKAWRALRVMLLHSLPRRFFACERSVGCSQCWSAITSLGFGRRLLAIVLGISVERCCCWLLSETK